MTGSRRASLLALRKGKGWWRHCLIPGLSPPSQWQGRSGQEQADSTAVLRSAPVPMCVSSASEKAGPGTLPWEPLQRAPTGCFTSSCHKEFSGTCRLHVGCQPGLEAVHLRLKKTEVLEWRMGSGVVTGNARSPRTQEKVAVSATLRRQILKRGWVSSRWGRGQD